MLGKLIKHEWVATSKLLLPLYIILCIATVLGKILLVSMGNNDLFSPFLGLLSVFYVFYLFIIAAVTQIYLIVRFYKNMFTDEGYLTNTLPVTSSQLINTKLLVAFCWNIINIVFISCSIFVIVVDSKTIPFIRSGWNDAINSFENYFGFEPTGYIILFIILTLGSVIFSLLMLYCSIALGHKFGKHKIIGSFVAYIALYAIIQIIATVITTVGGMFWDFNNVTSASAVFPIMNTYIVIFSVIYVLFGIAFYLITNTIVNKQLNLE